MGCTNSTLSDKEVQTGLRNVIRDGLTSSIMSTLSGSVFLVAFAVALGAPPLIVGLLATIPALSNIILIPTTYLVEKYRVRRSITMLAAGLSRSVLLLIAIIPLVFPLALALPLVLLALVANSLLASIGGCSFNCWMHDLVPRSSLGRFFSKRMLLSTAVAIPLALLGGFFLDFWKMNFPVMVLAGYSLLFVGGFIAGMVGVYFLSKVPEPKMESSEELPGIRQLLKQPFEDVNFKNLIVFLTSWNFAVNLAMPFLTVFMLRELGLDMSMVVMLMVLSQITSLAFFRVWGSLTDRFSNKSVLRISGPMMVGAIMIWALAAMFPSKAYIMPVLIVVHILMGAATAGVNLASGNIGLKLAPKGKATSYLASSALFSSMAAGTAPLLGGLVAQSFPHWEVFFLVAVILGVFSLHRLTKVKEDGEVKRSIVVKELVSEMRNEVKNISPVLIVHTVYERRAVAPKPIVRAKMAPRRSWLSAIFSFVWR
jgi:MFS family permease